MNTSNVVFRSHLMQQFASAARNQSRPPIALSRTSLAASSRRQRQGPPSVISNRYATSDDNHHRFSSASVPTIIDQPTMAPPADVENNEEHVMIANNDHVTTDSRAALANETSSSIDNETHHEEDSTTASSFQSISHPTRFLPSLDDHLRPALDRAVQCAQNVWKHNRMEPFYFKRLLSQSSIHALADIIKQVMLLKHHSKNDDKAERKRARWSQIPAYIVTLVEGQPNQEEGDKRTFDSTTTATTAFSPLPFVPPQTQRQLEDYASSYAAIQNLLLSLQAEHIRTKWVTGSVICTQAFRRLVHAKPTDRVVGLVMVMGNSTSTTSRQATQGRRTMQELVQDL